MERNPFLCYNACITKDGSEMALEISGSFRNVPGRRILKGYAVSHADRKRSSDALSVILIGELFIHGIL